MVKKKKRKKKNFEQTRNRKHSSQISKDIYKIPIDIIFNDEKSYLRMKNVIFYP